MKLLVGCCLHPDSTEPLPATGHEKEKKMNYRRATTALLASGVLVIAACGEDNRASTAAQVDPHAAWQVYYDLTHPEPNRAGDTPQVDPHAAWQVYYDLTHPEP